MFIENFLREIGDMECQRAAGVGHPVMPSRCIPPTEGAAKANAISFQNNRCAATAIFRTADGVF